jgi:hypothetical protein
MTQLRRLTSTSPNPLTRALLAAGREDAPSHRARVNAAIAIGVAGGLATTATAGGAAAGTATTGTVAASKWIGAATLLKVVGTTVVSGALVVGVVHEKQYLAAPAPLSGAHAAVAAAPAQAAVRVAHASTPPPPDSAPAPSEAPPPVEATPIELPALAATPRAPLAPSITARPALRAAPDHVEATLRDEVQRLDRVHAQVAAGKVQEALADLTAYDRAFPKGALSDEAELLRIETLVEAGDIGVARARAERLLAEDEHGPHARRVRALLASLRSGAGAP